MKAWRVHLFAMEKEADAPSDVGDVAGCRQKKVMLVGEQHHSER